MKLIGKEIALAQRAMVTFFEADEQLSLDSSDLDSYLFNREARLDEVWGSERGAKLAQIGSDRIQQGTALCRADNESENHPVTHSGARRWRKSPVAMSAHSPRKLGLAFGGGFARAIAHIGVLKVLEEEKISVDLVAGTSAGAILGAAYCAGISATEMEQMATASRFRDFARMSLSRFGLYASDRIANFCERELRIRNFEDLKIPLAIAATDVRTGEPVVFTKGPVVDPMRASCAYPGMFPPVEVDGRSLIDGMLAYSVPTTPLRDMGAECVMGVYLAADKLRQPAPRHIFEVIAHCLSIAEDKLCNLWKKDADLVIEPDIKGFSIDSFDRAKELIANGEKATRAALPQLRRLLQLPEPRILQRAKRRFDKQDIFSWAMRLPLRRGA